MKRVEQHHELMIRIQKHRNVFNNATAVAQTTGSETAPTNSTNSDDKVENNELSTSPC